MQKADISRSNFIHLLRWTSAFLVVFSHLRSILFKDFPLITHKGYFTLFFYFFTGLGHQAVIVFFVLSGYLIAGSIITQIRKGVFDVKNYALSRASRLYAVLIFALLLTVVLDHVGIYFDKIGLYTGKLNAATLGFSISDRLSFSYFSSSLLMLQTIVLPPLGSNSPLWSLANEFWYYILFPCCALLIVFIKVKSSYSLLCVFILILLGWFLPFNIEVYFLIWLIGLIPFYISLKQTSFKFILAILFVVWLALKKTVHIDNFLYDFFLGLIVAFWVASFDNYNQLSNQGLLKINEKLSSFSYSTYLVHFPIIMLTLTLIKNHFSTGIWIEPGLKGYFIFTCVFVFVVACSYLVATFTEFKTARFRGYLKQIFLK